MDFPRPANKADRARESTKVLDTVSLQSRAKARRYGLFWCLLYREPIYGPDDENERYSCAWE
jgi:hypothetical protein